MSQLYELNLNPGESPLKVFDGAGSTVFDARFASLKVWMKGVTSVPPSPIPWATGAAFVSDVPHNHPSGKSCLATFKVYGRNSITGITGYRTPFVRIYNINSNCGDFMTVADTFIRFGNMHWADPTRDNTQWYYFAMFDQPAR